MGCTLLVLALALPLSGLIALAVVIPAAIARRLAMPLCPACGYDESGRVAGSACPECGRNRADAERAAYPSRPGLVLWPVLAPLLIAAPFVYFATTFGPGERTWAVACLVAPFLLLTIVGTAAGLHRWPRVAWACVGVPATLAFAAAAWVYVDLAQPIKPFPGMDSYIPALHRQLGPLAFAGACGIVIGVLHIAIAVIAALSGPRLASPQSPQPHLPSSDRAG
jgi:hypothetical protein